MTSSAPPRELLIVAGEASGDAHGAALVDQLRLLDPSLQVVGVGGDRMDASGVELLQHYRGIAVVGITEVLSHLGEIRRAMNRILAAVESRPIVGVVLVDYPDFNMVLARRLRRRCPDVPITYFISPQVWAWRSGRVNKLARLVDRMLVILPFEEELYSAAGVPVDFVGHPLLDETHAAVPRAEFAARHGLDPDARWLGLLPGSRQREVERLLPPMLGAAELMLAEGGYEVVIPRAAAVERDTFDVPLAGLSPSARAHVHVVEESYQDLLGHLHVAAVCSGTATLETALAGVPEVVVYRTSWLTYNLGKSLVRISDIALANVVAGRRGVPELLQNDVTPETIAAHLKTLSEGGPARSECVEFLKEVRSRLGEPGASRRAAQAVIEQIEPAMATDNHG
ncbi:MAG: lipid-A-disaccharide synthase [Acidobacteria bacterium]|nr:lipid-A-disaccharide synthase [Acidobacteriota bacterium]